MIPLRPRRLGVFFTTVALLVAAGGAAPVATAAPADQVKARNAANALSVHGIDDVRGNLTLPDTGPDGTAVRWTSSDPSVITPTGGVTRPAAGGKTSQVTLTASVSSGRDTATRRFTATVTPKPPQQPLKGYSFFYFTGEGTPDGEQIYSAASKGNAPLNFTELNNGKPVLRSSLGELGVRDPFILRSPDGDKFYLLATDLKIYNGRGWDAAQRTGSRSIMVWESTDLVNWSRQRSVEVSPPTAGNTWAPEAFWDAKRGTYVVFWASKLYAESDPAHTGDSYNRMLYATTRDFVTFSQPKVWIDPGYSVIDSTIIQDKDTYYRFTKDERNPTSSSPCSKYITAEKSTDLLDPSYDFVADCIGKGTDQNPGLSRGEGPTGFKSNTENKWYLFIDEYGGRGYVPFETTDLASGKWTMSTGAKLPASPRHGTVLPVTQAELDRLTAPATPPKADRNGLVAHWPLNGKSGQNATDSTGHGYDGALAGDVKWADGALEFGGTNGHVQLPNNLLNGAPAATVSADVFVSAEQQTPYFLYGFGNTGPTGVGDGYLFGTGGTDTGGLKGAIATGNWTTEQQVASSGGLPRGVWKNLTLTVGGGTGVLYLDGVEVARNDKVTIKPSDIGGGITAANYLGRSVYAGDRTFKGKMKDVRLYNRALSGAEVAGLPSNSTLIRAVELGSLKAPAIIDAGAGTVVLPVRAGTDLRSLSPKFTLAPGATIKPGDGRPVDLRRPKKYTVSAPGGQTRVWTVEARELRTPSLPGLNADPNIIAFGDTYYLYPTTDGFDGWGSTTFSAWSSKNLVDWTNHGVALDLGPGVSWADKNDEWYIAYHRFAIPGGDGMHRETTIDKLNFTHDGAIAPIVPTLEGVAPRPIRGPVCGTTHFV